MPLIISFLRSCSSLSKAGLRKVDLGVGTGFLFEAGEAGAISPFVVSPFMFAASCLSFNAFFEVVADALMTDF